MECISQMRIFARASLTAALILLCLPAGAAEDKALAHARELAKQGIVFDGHNDLPWAIRNNPAAPGDVNAYDLRTHAPGKGQTDIPRLRAGGVGAQFWSVYTPGEAAGGFAHTQLEQIDIARRMIARYPDTFQLALTAADVRAARAKGRIASLLGAEGGHAIEDSLALLRAYYDLGVRYMTLTHNVNLSWADSAAEPPAHGGLTPFGEQVVHEMNRLGMLVDLAHVSPETMDDALRVSQAPVIFSHSSSKALCNVPRNVPDDILRRMPANGGVVMVAFVVAFVNPEAARITQPAMEEMNRRLKEVKDPAQREAIEKEIFGKLVLPPTPISMVADHIEHIRDLAGVDHVGFGSDFDGNDDWPEGLSDVSMYPNLIAELIRRGWSDADIRKVAGGNVLRALEQAEAVAARLQKAGS
jgi:membrane dipeptidase